MKSLMKKQVGDSFGCQKIYSYLGSGTECTILEAKRGSAMDMKATCLDFVSVSAAP